MAKKIAIASGKGGVGKSSLTVGIGKALAARGKKVLLIDCDCLKSIDLLTGVTEFLLYNWGDVVKNRCDSESALYDAGDVKVITCPDSYEDITPEEMKELIKSYEESFDYILLDSPAGIDKGLTLASCVADRGLVVSTPDLVCVRSACIAARQMENLGVTDTRLIINRVKKRDVTKGRLLNVDSVIDSTEIQLIGVVPEDAKIRLGSMGQGIFKKGQVSYRAFCNIAGRVEGETVTLKL